VNSFSGIEVRRVQQLTCLSRSANLYVILCSTPPRVLVVTCWEFATTNGRKSCSLLIWIKSYDVRSASWTSSNLQKRAHNKHLDSVWPFTAIVRRAGLLCWRGTPREI